MTDSASSARAPLLSSEWIRQPESVEFVTHMASFAAQLMSALNYRNDPAPGSPFGVIQDPSKVDRTNSDYYANNLAQQSYSRGGAISNKDMDAQGMPGYMIPGATPEEDARNARELIHEQDQYMDAQAKAHADRENDVVLIRGAQAINGPAERSGGQGRARAQ